MKELEIESQVGSLTLNAVLPSIAVAVSGRYGAFHRDSIGHPCFTSLLSQLIGDTLFECAVSRETVFSGGSWDPNHTRIKVTRSGTLRMVRPLIWVYVYYMSAPP